MTKFIIILISMFLAISDISYTQIFLFDYHSRYSGTYQELFFGRQPSARAEALGRSFVSVKGDANSYYYNPAGLASVEGLNISGTFANPYYLATEAKYYFLSASYKIKDYGVIGFSRDYLKVADIIVTNELGEVSGEFTLSLRNYRLSLASEIIPDLFLGANLNLFRPYDISEFTNTNSDVSELLYIDFGILKTFNFQTKKNDHSINVGSSVMNLNSAKFTYDNPSQVARLPVIFRIGASYNLLLDDHKLVSNLKTYNFLFVTEYQRLFNSDYFDGLKAGFELTLLELLSIRTGYYHQDINDVNCENCKSSLNEFTFGIGVTVPLKKFSSSNIPIEIKFDYTALDQPNSIKSTNFSANGGSWEDFHVYNLKLNWSF